MSEKKAVSKNTKPNFFVRFANGFVNLFKKIGAAFKNMWHELRKVTWPSRDKLVNYSTIVVLFIVFMMVVIGLLDLGASQLVNLIMSL
ncbi:MAG: preprotein translocase subunit SecE [Clostridia bacterium]|nr:preprotein translocase subunit SecE [Clostridia bacterium]